MEYSADGVAYTSGKLHLVRSIDSNEGVIAPLIQRQQSRMQRPHRLQSCSPRDFRGRCAAHHPLRDGAHEVAAMAGVNMGWMQTALLEVRPVAAVLENLLRNIRRFRLFRPVEQPLQIVGAYQQSI